MVNRRMVGHGNLAERAVLSVMPETEDFPYTTRVSAEVICPFQREFNLCRTPQRLEGSPTVD